MFVDLFKNLTSQHLILTVNQRLCINLRREYQQWQIQQDLITWDSLNVSPLYGWLTDCWQRYQTTNNTLLTSQQERYIWQKIIQNDARYALIQPTRTAALAQQAWQTINEWQLSLEKIHDYANQEVSTFIQWAHQFLQQCEHNQWTPSTSIIKDITDCLQKNTMPLPDSITLVGFDEHTPAQQHLFTLLSEHIAVTTYQHSQTTNEAKRISLNNTSDEITVMARWAKQQWQNNPSQQIGCIIPNLNTLRDKVEHIFMETFDLHHFNPADNNKTPFNFSAGRPLNSYTIINDAMALLALLQQKRQTPLTLLHQWLRSPYFQLHPSDAECAATLEQKLEQKGKATLSATIILDILANLKTAYPETTWLRRWHHLIKCNIPGPLSPSQWSSWIAQQLQYMGWPGGRDINSLEHQLLERFKHILTECNTLNSISPKCSLKDILSYLQDTLINTTFQPEGSEAPIQILGVLEATGVAFDSQWIMNLSDESWPAPAQANPFLPASMQREYRMPHADAQRELEFSQTITQRLLNNGLETIISSPQQVGERQLKPSPLIIDLAEIHVEDLILANRAIEQVLVPAPTFPLNDFQAPPLSDREQPRGGTWILKQQAQCPFKAFASTRLQAIGPPTTDIGLSPAQSGTLVHVALEWLWQQIKDSETLNTLDETALDQLITESIQVACEKTSLCRTQAPGFLALEQQRIAGLLKAWLKLEKNRPPFKVIAEEQQHTMQWNNLSFRISIDRIDELANGNHVIIDYKTNETTINSWFGERPEEPQLPMYYLASEKNHLHLSGMAFAQLKKGKLGFKGLMHEEYDNNPNTIDGFTPVNQLKDQQATWQQCQQHWETTLHDLANEYCSGNATVTPLNSNSCRYCDLHALCRVFEQ